MLVGHLFRHLSGAAKLLDRLDHMIRRHDQHGRRGVLPSNQRRSQSDAGGRVSPQWLADYVPLSHFSQFLLTVAAVLLLSWINIIGTRWSARTQNVTTVIKVSFLVLLIVGGAAGAYWWFQPELPLPKWFLAMHLLTRNLFRVDFEWRRLAQIALLAGGIGATGDALLPTHGAAGLAARAAAFAAIPAALYVTRFAHPQELARLRMLIASRRGAPA